MMTIYPKRSWESALPVPQAWPGESIERLVRIVSEESSDRGQKAKVLLDGEQLGRTLGPHDPRDRRTVPRPERPRSRGYPAQRSGDSGESARLFHSFYQVDPPTGAIDITFYRDDLETRAGPEYMQPIVHSTELSFDVNGKTIVLVDDVLYTGRTIRAAIDALFDYGRPTAVRLAVLVDRGHRDLPIRPDFMGKNVPTSRNEQVVVRLVETDGVDEVVIED